MKRGRIIGLVAMEIVCSIVSYWWQPTEWLASPLVTRSLQLTLQEESGSRFAVDDDDSLLWDDDDVVIAEARQPYQYLSIDQDDTIIEREFAAQRRLRGVQTPT